MTVNIYQRLSECIEQIEVYFSARFTAPAETQHLRYHKVGKAWEIQVINGGQATSLCAANLAQRIKALKHLDELEEALKAAHIARDNEVAEAVDFAETWLARRTK